MSGEGDNTGIQGYDLGFEDPRVGPGIGGEGGLVLSIEGFEGPLDVLLVLARAQKVDLTQISILELVEQYLVFVNEARALKLELAADYLVMAAWLAYLKSRLLLPAEDDDDEPSAEIMALRLQLQLQRLEAMREAGATLMSSNRLGRDMFPRGNPEGIRVIKSTAYDCTLYELLKAYAIERNKGVTGPLNIKRRPIYSLEEAIERLSKLIGTAIEWTDLQSFLPDDVRTEPGYRRSAVASIFVAGLELAREGKADIQQDKDYGPLYLRAKKREDNA